MSAERTLADNVRSVRELRNGVQADVYVGWSARGRATLRVMATGPKVMEAMDTLRAALLEEADAILKGAQDDTLARGRQAVGR